MRAHRRGVRSGTRLVRRVVLGHAVRLSEDVLRLYSQLQASRAMWPFRYERRGRAAPGMAQIPREPSRVSRMMSAWPAWRAVSSIIWNRTYRTLHSRMSERAHSLGVEEVLQGLALRGECKLLVLITGHAAMLTAFR